MKRTRCLVSLLAVVSLFALVSCVELLAQRISLYHDAQSDELRILLFYDGIHDSRDNSNGNGAEQIPTFVANGDIMLLDWPMHFKMADIRGEAADENNPAAMRAFAKAVLETIHVQPVGHYRDVHGQIGTAQAITIFNATDFIVKANAAISEMFLGAL